MPHTVLMYLQAKTAIDKATLLEDCPLAVMWYIRRPKNWVICCSKEDRGKTNGKPNMWSICSHAKITEHQYIAMVKLKDH